MQVSNHVLVYNSEVPGTPDHLTEIVAWSRCRGGLTTKIHALADRHGRPVRLALTPGQTHGGQAAAELLAELPEGAIVLATKPMMPMR